MRQSLKIMISTIRQTALLLLVAVFCLSCASTKEEKKEKPMPFSMQKGNTFFMNTYSMAQNDFSLSGGIPLAPNEDLWIPFPEDEAQAILHEVFFEAGFEMERDVLFRLGKINTLLNGWSADKLTGFVWLDERRLEPPRFKSFKGRMKSIGMAFTVRDPEKLSLSEITSLEIMALEDRAWIAVVPAVQFGYYRHVDPVNLVRLLALPDDEFQEAATAYLNRADDLDARYLDTMRSRLFARTRMYLQWVKERQRMKRVRDKKKEQER